MLEVAVYLLLLFGIFLAGLVNHLRWRRRMIRLREYWKGVANDVQVERKAALNAREKSFAQQRADFRRREQLMGQKILEYSKKLRVLSAANEELWKKVNRDA